MLEQLCKQDKFYDSASRTNFVYFSKNACRILEYVFGTMVICDAYTDTMGHGMVVARRHNGGGGGWRRQESMKDKFKVRETIAIVALSQAFNRLINKY